MSSNQVPESRDWRLRVIDLVTRIGHGERGLDFRRGVMETVHQLDDDGDLRFLDVFTAAVGSVRLSSRTVRTGAIVTLFLMASIFSGVGLANAQRANEVARSQIKLLQVLSKDPRPPLVWTSAAQGLRCLELKKSTSSVRSPIESSSSANPTTSLELYCYPSRLVDSDN